MASLKDLFRDLQTDPTHYLGASKGDEFENRIHISLNDHGYTRIQKSDMEKHSGTFGPLKDLVTDKLSVSFPENPYAAQYTRHFVIEPYGSQDYPDVLVFHDDQVVILEIKFSTKDKTIPMWNSNLPRPTGVYIFGSRIREDVTFFRGCDIISVAEAKALHEFFDELRVMQQRFNKDVPAKQAYGFSVYVRKAFEQLQKHNESATINFFANPDRKRLEQNVINDVP